MADKNSKNVKELPNYVKEGIKRGQTQARVGKTKSTGEVMAKHEKEGR